MRKTTKKLLAGSLVICMVLGFPVNISGAQAANNFHLESCITALGNYQMGANAAKNIQKEDTPTTEPKTEKGSEANDANVKENTSSKSEGDTTNNTKSGNNENNTNENNTVNDTSNKDDSDTIHNSQNDNSNTNENDTTNNNKNSNDSDKDSNNQDNSNKSNTTNNNTIENNDSGKNDVSDENDISDGNNVSDRNDDANENQNKDGITPDEQDHLQIATGTISKNLIEQSSIAKEPLEAEASNSKELNAVRMIPQITNNGIFDYRTWADSANNPKIDISVIKYYFYTPNPEEDDGHVTEESSELNEEEKSKLTYALNISDTDVIFSDATEIAHTACNGTIPLYINGVGKTKLTISPKGIEYGISPSEIDITVTNSTLYDTDFYIELLVDSNQAFTPQQYDFESWLNYLDQHNHWVNGQINAVISESGKPYFDHIHMETVGTEKQTYTLWAENPKRNASTKNEENGTRTFVAGIDIEAPELTKLQTQSKCYEPTKTETEQYYAENFILKGSYTDAASGVSKIEYTTNFTDGDKAIWKEAATCESICGAEENIKELPFEIVLSDGIYKSIAIRGYDNAGNVSIPQGFKNENGDYIQVTVDKSSPVLQISAISDGVAYNGSQDNWTNTDVTYNISVDKTSCPYAGIYQYEYAYEKIGDTVNHSKGKDLPEEWEQMQYDDVTFGSLEVHEDKNGYYYFQAISKSGVRTKAPVSHRILIQHSLPKLLPIQEYGADEEKCKNGWYNKSSGVPRIRFVYPEYDTGVTSKEYSAPATIHYVLSANKDNNTNYNTDTITNTTTELILENSITKGILSSGDTYIDSSGKTVFKLTEDNPADYIIDFAYDKETGYAKDGIYTLTYWITDKAGNKSEKQSITYKIDTHEPTNLTVSVAGEEMPVDSEASIVYDRFYQKTVSGTASAQYGISQKGSLQVLKARRIGEWKNSSKSAFDNGEAFDIAADQRCILYIRAEDNAGNIAEGWTKGIIVDSKAPNEASKKELVIAPEGANEHGFFHDDINVKISIKDAPEDDNCAALMIVRSSIGKNGTDTITGKELFSFTKEFPTDAELATASSYESTQTINAKENESNEAYIEVTAIDRAGNTKTSTQALKIDVTKPEITITFDSENAVNGCYYNHSRTATIHVHELNFNPSDTKLAITKDGEPFGLHLSDWEHDGNEHWASVNFYEDGDYTMEAYCTDLAGNQSETVQAAPFTIDQTAPQVSIILQANHNMPAFHEYYYNTALTATITVAEHNFDTNDFALAVAPISKNAVWTHDGDIHTARITFDEDNAYQIQCACIDRAGNTANGEMEKAFILDTAAPVLDIKGVIDGSANSGSITPIITALDLNMDSENVAISVVTGKGESVNVAVETTAINDASGIGYQFLLSDMNAKKDNIYQLTVSASDRAGNESTLTYSFSLNRKGSAYDLTNLVKLIEKQYHTYASLEDITIIEMNIDTIEQFEVYISRNGELGYPASYKKNVQGSKSTGYIYTYSLLRENFAEEGCYRLSLYSRDRAGNEANNALSINGKEITFTIDNTAPKVVIDGIETGKVYDVESQAVSVAITDNFKLAEAELTLVNNKNEVLERWDYMGLSKEGDTIDISIPMYNEELTLLYKVKDAAGNEAQTFYGEKTALTDFFVTKDKLVQFLNKPTQTPFGRVMLVTLSSAACITAAAGTALIHKRKRRIAALNETLAE